MNTEAALFVLYLYLQTPVSLCVGNGEGVPQGVQGQSPQEERLQHGSLLQARRGTITRYTEREKGIKEKRV